MTTDVQAVRPDDWFEDVTATCGVHLTYRNGREAGRYFMIESFGGGAAIVDYDRDGDCDLFLSGGGTISRDGPGSVGGLPCALFRNAGSWHFEDVSHFGGFAEAPDYSQGCAVTDFDADGFADLFLCCYGRSRLYRNLGDGTYTEVRHEEQLANHDWSTAAVFADFDRDGFPDLVVARYADWSPATDVKCSQRGIRDLCGPTSYDGTICRAFHNCGNGMFEEWTAQLGLRGSVRGLAVVAADVNLDGWVDLYVASDVTANQLYAGGPQLPMVECAVSAGVAFGEWGQAESSMGVDIGDYNGDGLPDIWITSFEREDHALYRNLGHGMFMHSTVSAGLSGLPRMRVGFGTAMTDFDGDGRPDLFVLNGNPIYQVAESPFKQHSQLFQNLDGHFQDVSDKGGRFFRELHSGRGSAVADFDDDGAADIITIQMNEPVQILRNRRAPANFVRVLLAARNGEPDATGARVWCEYQGRRLAQFAVRATGFFSQSDSRMIFPVSEDLPVADVTVEWPGRAREVFRSLGTRTTNLLIEGRGEYVDE